MFIDAECINAYNSRLSFNHTYTATLKPENKYLLVEFQSAASSSSVEAVIMIPN